jgi:hypothetical protein
MDPRDPSPPITERPRSTTVVSAEREPLRQLGLPETAAVERLAAERAVEVAARAEAAAAGAAVRASMERQARLLDQLTGAGVPFTRVVVRLARLEGRTLSVVERCRAAARLRQRKLRARVTGRNAHVAAPSPATALPSLRSSSFTSAAARGEENDMAQLVERIITERYAVDEELEDLGEHVDDEDVDEEEDESAAAPSRRRAKR